MPNYQCCISIDVLLIYICFLIILPHIPCTGHHHTTTICLLINRFIGNTSSESVYEKIRPPLYKRHQEDTDVLISTLFSLNYKMYPAFHVNDRH